MSENDKLVSPGGTNKYPILFYIFNFFGKFFVPTVFDVMHVDQIHQIIRGQNDTMEKFIISNMLAINYSISSDEYFTIFVFGIYSE